jgi:hypothetical protein
MILRKLILLCLISSLGANVYLWNYYVAANLSVNSSYEEGYDLGFHDGYDSGYSKGVVDGVGQGYNLRNPTYVEVIIFLEEDKTDALPYIEDKFVCHHYAKTFKNHAFEKGYFCFYVNVYLEGGLHTIVAFNTTDRGMVFIEPQSDDIIELKVGEHYNKLIRGSIRLLGNDEILGFDLMF